MRFFFPRTLRKCCWRVRLFCCCCCCCWFLVVFLIWFFFQLFLKNKISFFSGFCKIWDGGHKIRNIRGGVKLLSDTWYHFNPFMICRPLCICFSIFIYLNFCNVFNNDFNKLCCLCFFVRSFVRLINKFRIHKKHIICQIHF